MIFYYICKLLFIIIYISILPHSAHCLEKDTSNLFIVKTASEDYQNFAQHGTPLRKRPTVFGLMEHDGFKSLTPEQQREAIGIAFDRDYKDDHRISDFTPEQYQQARNLYIDRHAPKPREPKIVSTGTSFFINKHGYLLTNAHVVDRCKFIRLVMQNIVEDVEIIAIDMNNDLALLHVKSQNIPGVATLYKKSDIQVGQEVVVAGYPLRGMLSDGIHITTGNVSSLAGPSNDSRLLQFTAPVQPGNSGGPLFDDKGNVIGIVVGKLDAFNVSRRTGDIPQNVNFAINSDVVRNFLDIYKIDYKTSIWLKFSLAKTELAQNAKSYTFPVECWR